MRDVEEAIATLTGIGIGMAEQGLTSSARVLGEQLDVLLARLRTVEAELAELRIDGEQMLEMVQMKHDAEIEATDALRAAEARVEALQPFLKHRHGCAALATAGGMFAPGPCTCGLAALAVSGNQPQ